MARDKTILAIGAHPDDVEFRCAGTLSRLRKKGCKIVIATVANGDCGTAEYSAEEIARIRRGEAMASAAILGAPYRCIGEGDLAIDCDTETRRKVTALVREFHPLIVLTHPLVDYMVDHEVTSRLVRDACFAAGVPNFTAPGGHPPMNRIPHLYYFLPGGGTDNLGRTVPPQFLVDITAEMDVKKRMLKCHASQRNWLLKHHGVDHYINMMAADAERLGRLAGCGCAEGFTQHLGTPYPTDNKLLEILRS
ncbi:MAG: PIG-L family deacetylase [Planctomycetes bacterium]|nr:PIG-L family deacetylase [Planctomycetota bacterium]